MLSQSGEPPRDRPEIPRRNPPEGTRRPPETPEPRADDLSDLPESVQGSDPDRTRDEPAPGVNEYPSDSEFSTPEEEDDYVLRELDRLRGELAPRRRGPAGAGDGEETPRPSELSPRPGSSPRDEANPYLVERLTVARSAVEELVHQAENVGQGLAGLRSTLERVDREIDRATEELGYLQTAPWEETEVAAWRVPTAHATPEAAPARSRSGTGPPGANPSAFPVPPPLLGSYEDFTVGRYNRTVSELHRRRLTLGWGTVAAALAISGVLLWLTLQAHEPIPPIWLAVLPLIWMIPVPFFVAAFRGTQRVLRENRLELSEDM